MTNTPSFNPPSHNLRLAASLSIALVVGLLAGCPGPEPYLSPEEEQFCKNCKPGGSLATGLNDPHRYACKFSVKDGNGSTNHPEWHGICMEDGASDDAREAKCDADCNGWGLCVGSHRQGSAHWCADAGYGGSGSDEETGDASGEESGSPSGDASGSNDAPPWTPSLYVTYVESGNLYEIDADFMDYLKTDPWALLNDSTYSQETSSGVVLRGVQTGTLAEVLGFEEHDVIKSINGHEPHSFVELTDVYLALETETSFTVEVTRGSQTIVLQFELV